MSAMGRFRPVRFGGGEIPAFYPRNDRDGWNADVHRVCSRETRRPQENGQVRAILVLLAPATLLACDETPTTTAPPTRPSHVPADAVWRGGADGGNWHRCAIESDVISCTYFQESSDQFYTQKFRLCAQRSVSDWVARMDGVGGANAE